MKKVIKAFSELGTLEFILVSFILWRILITFFALIGVLFLPVGSPFLGGEPGAYSKTPLLWGWANFDGAHYWAIAKRGYVQFEQAFFPVYPLVVRVWAKFLGNLLFSGLLVSHLALLFALYLFYYLMRLDFKKSVARLALILLLIFPTSFYFGSFYTESFFLALILASFYAARKKSWFWAGMIGAFASATRLAGIFLLPALVVEFYLQAKKTKTKFHLKDFLSLLLIPLGLGIYIFYLWRTTGDPLYFFHVQPFFGAERSGGKIILLYQVFWRYLKMIFTTPFNHTYFIVWLELVSFVSFFAALILALFNRKVRFSYTVFGFCLLLLPTLTGTLSSVPRYVLPIFPGFIVFALYGRKMRFLKWGYFLISLVLSAVCVMFFIRGYWIS